MTSDRSPAFEFHTTDDGALPSEAPLVLGLTAPGLVGLTAVDALVSELETTQVGYVTTRGLPDVTPFSDGTPRHPIRLYAAPEAGLTMLVGELFLPVGLAEPFVDGLRSFVRSHDVSEVTVLHGVPFAHGPDQHAVFSVSTTGYRERRLADTGIEPLAGGFFDGVAGELMAQGLEGTLPPVGSLVTPAHPPGPDFGGAVLTLEAIETLYDITVDESELRQRAAELNTYYEGLADRMQSLQDQNTPQEDAYPEDRMYM